MNMDKTVCSCYKIKIKDIKKAIEKGATSYKEVKKETKVGKSCGKCKDYAKSVTKELLKEMDK